jgi:hypothetical protein
METAQEGITTDRFEELKELLDKYADELANLFGSLFVLSAGSIIFAIITLFLQGEWKLPVSYFWILIIASAVIGSIALKFMFYFAKKVPVLIDEAKTEKHKNVVYVISKYSLDTLIAAGVGNDITDFLQLESREKELKMSIPLKPESDEVDWLNDLRDKFGEARVLEFEETLLKYTCRKVKISTTENS